MQLSATGTVLRKSGTLVVTKIAVAWVVAAIASRIIPDPWFAKKLTPQNTESLQVLFDADWQAETPCPACGN